MNKEPRKRFMIRTLFLALFAVTAVYLSGCAKYEYSAGLTSLGVVSDTYFAPSGVIVGADGGMIGYPAEFSVVFRCDNGLIFTVSGSKPQHAELWKKSVKGQPVTVYYHAVYLITNKGKSLHDHKFIDARPITLGEL